MTIRKSYASLLVADMAALDDIKGEYLTLAHRRDPDGNLLTLATPPSRPFPPA